MPPIYEASGQQKPRQRRRWRVVLQPGEPGGSRKAQTDAGKINFILSTGPGGKDLYPNHLKNFAPRFALAYSPQGATGFPNSCLAGQAARRFVLDGDDL